MNKRIISILISCFVFLIFTEINAQQHDLLLYNYKDVAQSSLLNPGIRTNQRVSVGLFQVGGMANSSSFSAYDVMGKGTIFNDNVEAILAGLGNRDFVRSNVNTNLFFTSFNISKRIQLSFGGLISVNQHLELPENLIRMVARGNDQFENKLVNFGGWSTELTAMASIHAGASYVVNDKLTVGARVYRHNGIFNAHMRRRDNNLDINFDPDIWTVETEVTARGSFIGQEIFVIQDENFRVRNIDVENVDDILNLLNLTENVGYSVDLGAEYVFNRRWSASASILGLGSIKYTANPQQIGADGIFNYTGINYNIREESFGYGELIDSLLTLYNPEIRGTSDYRRALPTQVFGEIQYNISRMNELHGIVRYTNWLGQNYFDFNLRYLFKPTRFVSAMANISTTQAAIYGGGLGLQLYFPGFQFFVMADIMTNNVSISHFRGAMVQTGINFALWDRSKLRERRKARREAEHNTDAPLPLPLPEESDSNAVSDTIPAEPQTQPDENNGNQQTEQENDAIQNHFNSNMGAIDIHKHPQPKISKKAFQNIAYTNGCGKTSDIEKVYAKCDYLIIIDERMRCYVSDDNAEYIHG